jgi:hypothetical protein
MAHHNIQINLKNGHAVPALSSAGELWIGDTVEYSSPDGRVRVVFDGPDGSPFGDSRPDVVHDSETRQLIKSGKKYPCKCFIETGWSPGGRESVGPHVEIGWSPSEPESGGDHDVKP